MDDEISKLLNKKSVDRKKSTTPVPDDELLTKLMERVADSRTLGLCWDKAVYPEFAARLEKIGFKLRDGDDCWQWAGKKANNGTRPQYRNKQAYLFTIASLNRETYTTHVSLDVDHRCGNSLCVRPGVGHAEPNDRNIHNETGKPDGTRPKKPKATARPRP